MTDSKPSKPGKPQEGFPVPEDNPDGDRYAVYDTTAGRYVEGTVTADKTDADKAARAGDHLHVVRL